MIALRWIAEPAVTMTGSIRGLGRPRSGRPPIYH
jgi:hypothetical protein